MKFDATMALVLIDVQEAIDDPCFGELSNPDYLLRLKDVLSIWRGRNWPVFHIKTNDPDISSPYHMVNVANAFKAEAQPQPGETVIEKETPCAFINTGFGSMLRMDGCEKMLVCGVATQHGVDATVRHAAALGFEVFVLEEATAATAVSDPTGKEWPASYVQRLSMGVLGEKYASVVTMADVFAAL